MNTNLTFIKEKIYDKLRFELSDYRTEQESKEYDACQFKLNGKIIISRKAKITPKKDGQFVTFWKRKGNGSIEPYSDTDQFAFFIVNAESDSELGQFVFPKSVLIKKGIISFKGGEGKRAFRVYPIWDKVNSKQAERTQKWQLNYFYKINNLTDINEISHLFKSE
jgi:hypothetical protein